MKPRDLKDVLFWYVLRLWGFAGQVLIKVTEERWPGGSVTITPVWEEDP